MDQEKIASVTEITVVRESLIRGAYTTEVFRVGEEGITKLLILDTNEDSNSQCIPLGRFSVGHTCKSLTMRVNDRHEDGKSHQYWQMLHPMVVGQTDAAIGICVSYDDGTYIELGKLGNSDVYCIGYKYMPE